MGISVKKTVAKPKLKTKGDSSQLCGVSRGVRGTTDANRGSDENDGPRDSQAYKSTLRNSVGIKLGGKAKIGSGKERELEDESCVCDHSSVDKSLLEAVSRALRLPSSMDEGLGHSMLWSVNIGILVVSIGKWLSEVIASAKILKKTEETKLGTGSTSRRHPLNQPLAWCLLFVVACPQQLVSGQNLAGFVWESSNKYITYDSACDIDRNAKQQVSCVCSDVAANYPSYFHCTTGNCGSNGEPQEASRVQGLCGQCPAGQFYGYYSTNAESCTGGENNVYNGYGGTSEYDITQSTTCGEFDVSTADACMCDITTYTPNSSTTNYCFYFVCNHVINDSDSPSHPLNMASNWAVGCQECPAGTFNAVQGNEYCNACPAGTSSSSVGATKCPPCNPGQYSSDAGSTECSVCGAGTISNAGKNVTGSKSCINCGPGQSSSSGSWFASPVILVTTAMLRQDLFARKLKLVTMSEQIRIGLTHALLEVTPLPELRAALRAHSINLRKTLEVVVHRFVQSVPTVLMQAHMLALTHHPIHCPISAGMQVSYSAWMPHLLSKIYMIVFIISQILV
eukprot:scaffold11331_cov82-Skeletonema_dohrnii-CCMP3373.AAC.3